MIVLPRVFLTRKPDGNILGVRTDELDHPDLRVPRDLLVREVSPENLDLRDHRATQVTPGINDTVDPVLLALKDLGEIWVP